VISIAAGGRLASDWILSSLPERLFINIVPNRQA